MDFFVRLCDPSNFCDRVSKESSPRIKRPKAKMESEFRPWSELNTDLLVPVFIRLSLEEFLTVVPLVCKAWNSVVSEPYCWCHIDVYEWSLRSDSRCISPMLEMVLNRCRGFYHSRSVSSLATQNFTSLRNLSLSRSEISDSTAVQIAPNLPNLRILDLSFCLNISDRGIAAFGNNCELLDVFYRKLDPTDRRNILLNDLEVLAIANTMPNLRRLYLAYPRMSPVHVPVVLSQFSKLEYFHFTGLDTLSVTQKFLSPKIRS